MTSRPCYATHDLIRWELYQLPPYLIGIVLLGLITVYIFGCVLLAVYWTLQDSHQIRSRYYTPLDDGN